MINKAISRVIAVLEYMTNCKDGVGISEISRQLNIPKSSVSDILYTLFYLDYIQYDDSKLKTFKLGVRIYKNSMDIIEKLDIISIAAPILREISSKIRMTAYAAVERSGRVLFVDKAECGDTPYRIALNAGDIKEIHLTAAGKALMVSRSDEDIGGLLGVGCYNTKTKNSLSNYHDLIKEIHRVRSAGYAEEHFEENEYIYSIAVPVYDSSRQVIAALGVSMIKYDAETADRNDLAGILKKHADETSCKYIYKK